jgi:hypothetical protein
MSVRIGKMLSATRSSAAAASDSVSGHALISSRRNRRTATWMSPAARHQRKTSGRSSPAASS